MLYDNNETGGLVNVTVRVLGIEMKNIFTNGILIFFVLVGVLQSIITLSNLLGINLHLGKYEETKYIIAGIFSVGYTAANKQLFKWVGK